MNYIDALKAMVVELRTAGVIRFRGPLSWGKANLDEIEVELGPLPAQTTQEADAPKLEQPLRDDGLTQLEAEALYLSSGE